MERGKQGGRTTTPHPDLCLIQRKGACLCPQPGLTCQSRNGGLQQASV